jgi:hypothetical protein
VERQAEEEWGRSTMTVPLPLASSPPGEKANACQDQARQSGAGDGAGNGNVEADAVETPAVIDRAGNRKAAEARCVDKPEIFRAASCSNGNGNREYLIRAIIEGDLRKIGGDYVLQTGKERAE